MKWLTLLLSGVLALTSQVKSEQNPCLEAPWPTGEVWDSLHMAGVIDSEPLLKAKRYYLRTTLPEEGDPPESLNWEKVSCPQGADIWVFVKKHPYVVGLQTVEVYHVLITGREKPTRAIYNRTVIPSGSVWTPLEKEIQKEREWAEKQRQKQLKKKEKEEARKQKGAKKPN